MSGGISGCGSFMLSFCRPGFPRKSLRCVGMGRGPRGPAAMFTHLSSVLRTAMKALSVRQPFAHLIVTGIKRIENRFWATPYRGPLLIHAASRWHDTKIETIE